MVSSQGDFPLVVLHKVSLPLKKVCFLSSGWPKLWPLGHNAILFVFVCFCKKITEILEIKTIKLKKKKKKKLPIDTNKVTRSTGNKLFLKNGLSVDLS